MPDLKCPVCGDVLERQERVLRCRCGHSFDLAKKNYVNLLMSNKAASKRHGDDRQMVLSRQAFLEKGYYEGLRRALCAAAVKYSGARVELLDVGCGEGWYTEGVKAALEKSGRICRACGVDISKDALIQAAKRNCGLTLAVASVSALPVPDGSCDLLMNVFAPNDDGEFQRVLKPGGVLLKAVPLERHLMGLKAAVYERPYENPPAVYAPAHFSLLGYTEIRETLSLSGKEDIWNLFSMTPYYYKTSRADQEKLRALDALETELEFGVFALRRDGK